MELKGFGLDDARGHFTGLGPRVWDLGLGVFWGPHSDAMWLHQVWGFEVRSRRLGFFKSAMRHPHFF